MDIRLVAQSGRQRGQAVQVKAAKFFIGKHENCQLRPAVPDLGGIHALVEQREGRVFVRDFGAEIGTTINDRVLRAKELQVFDGDLLQIGPMVLSFVIQARPGDALAPALAEAPVGWPIDVSSETETTPAGAQPARRAASPSTASPATARAAVASPELQAGERVVWRSSLSYEMVGDLMHIVLIGPNLTEEDTIAPLRADLREILEQPWPRREVIDMEKITYVSSRAVGVILAHYQGLLREGGTVRLCNVSPRILPVLEQMRVQMLVDLYSSVEEAMQTEWD
jgi:anti-anti-sigma factor